jgi:hypothetical protein
MYGWFSEKSLSVSGTSFYLTEDGTEVEVTCITDDPEGKEYHWDDKQFLGKVVQWSRHGRPAQHMAVGLKEEYPYSSPFRRYNT